VETKDYIYTQVQKEILRKDLKYTRNCEEFMLLMAKHASEVGIPMWMGGKGKGQGRPPALDNTNKVWILWIAFKKHGTVASPNRKPAVKPKKVKPAKAEEDDGPPELIDDESEESATVSESGKKRAREEGPSAKPKRATGEVLKFQQDKLVEHFQKTIKYANMLGEPVSLEAMKIIQDVLVFPSRLS
jgi:hypothetical protein